MALRSLRLELDITVEELAAAAGVYRSTIINVESFRYAPSREVVERLVDAMAFLSGCDLAEHRDALTAGLPSLMWAGRSVVCDPLRAAQLRSRRRRTGLKASQRARR